MARQTVFKIVLVFISVFIAFVILEVFLRVLMKAKENPTITRLDPLTGLYTLLPDLDLQYYSEEGNTRVHLRSRDDGYVRTKDNKQEGEKRTVAILGDSYVQALQVDYGANFVSRVQELLNTTGNPITYELFNFGTGGQGTGEQIIKYEKHVRPYAPDAIVLVIYEGNDYDDNQNFKEAHPSVTESILRTGEIEGLPLHVSEKSDDESQVKRHLVKQILLSSAVIRTIHHIARYHEGVSRFLVRIGVFEDLRTVDRTLQTILPFMVNENEARSAGMDTTIAFIQNLENRLLSEGIPFGVVLIPSHWQVDPHFKETIKALASTPDFDLPARMIDDSIDVPVLNLSSALEKEIQAGNQVFILGRGHFTPHGHEFVSSKVSSFIESHVLK